MGMLYRSGNVMTFYTRTISMLVCLRQASNVGLVRLLKTFNDSKVKCSETASLFAVVRSLRFIEFIFSN